MPYGSAGASVLLLNVPFLFTLTVKKDFHLVSVDSGFRERGSRSGVAEIESRSWARDQFSRVAER
jgi:hypothetical protein